MFLTQREYEVLATTALVLGLAMSAALAWGSAAIVMAVAEAL